MRLFIVLIIVAVQVSAQRFGTQIAWPLPVEDAGASNFQLNSAANWLAVGFVAPSAKTLSTVEIYASAIAGTPAAGDFRAALYSDNGAKPGTETEGVTNSGTAPTATWLSASGFTASVTAGTAYWIVIKNLNGTPASNNFTIQRRSVGSTAWGVLGNAAAGSMGQMVAATSTDSGTNWTKSAAVTPLVLTWSDGTKSGFPYMLTAANGCTVYGTRECGLYFQNGPSAVHVRGAFAYAQESGTITGNVRLRIYEGAATTGRTLVATSTETPPGLVSSTATFIAGWFSSPIILKPYAWYALVMSETTQSDTSSNKVQLTYYDIKSDAGNLGGVNMTGSPQYTLSTDGGVTWTNTPLRYSHMGFFLDTERPTVVLTGGFAQ